MLCAVLAGFALAAWLANEWYLRDVMVKWSCERD